MRWKYSHLVIDSLSRALPPDVRLGSALPLLLKIIFGAPPPGMAYGPTP